MSMNRYDMRQSTPPFPNPNRNYTRNPGAGNMPRHTGGHAQQQQHHMGQQQSQHQQGQQQGNPQQQPRQVVPQPQVGQYYYNGQPPQQVYIAGYTTPQLGAQSMPSAGQAPVTIPRMYHQHQYQAQGYPQQMWNYVSMPQTQQAGIPYHHVYQVNQPVVNGQLPTQQMQAAHQQYYAQQTAAIQPTYVRTIASAPQQAMQIQHQQSHPVHHAHPQQQHVQQNQGVPIQNTQPPPPPPQDQREVVPTAPRERKVLKIINPETGEPVIEAPPAPPSPAVDASPSLNESSVVTSTDEAQPNSQTVPTVVLQSNSQSNDDVKPPEVDEPTNLTKIANARSEFYQKITKSAEEDRPLNEVPAPTPNNSTTTPVPTTSSTPAAAAAVEPEVSAPIPAQTVVVSATPVDEVVSVEEQPNEEIEEEENALETTVNTMEESSLADISTVSLDRYLTDDTPESVVAPTEPTQPSIAVDKIREPDAQLPESLVAKEPRSDPAVPVVLPPLEVPVASTPAQNEEVDVQLPVTTNNITEETLELTDSTTMQTEHITAEVLQNGDQIVDEDDEFVDYVTPEGVEDGEIIDVEEPEDHGKKKRISYDRETLLGIKGVASKDALPDMNSIPPEVMKDSNAKSQSSMYQNFSRGPPTPNFMPNRMGPHPGGRLRNNDRMMPSSMGIMGMRVPPPPPSAKVPPKIITTRRPEDLLNKDPNAWKPTHVKRVGGGNEKKDEEEIVQEEIVKKTRGILNKLTPENFEKLLQKFLDIDLQDKDERITAVIYVVFEKAIDEPSFSTAYAKMVKAVCDKSQVTAKKFRKNILDQCQKEFQKGSTAEEEIKALEEKIASTEGNKEELKLELEEKRNSSRRRSLGNVRFIGELYILQMLTPKIMIDCVGILLANEDEESYESLCKLLNTIGQRLDNQLKELEVRAQTASRSNPAVAVKFVPPEKFMEKTILKLKALSADLRLSSRIRFALLDVVELRECNWKPRRDADGPKKIGEVHRDAIRQQQEEKIQLQNLPPPGLMRQPPPLQKKPNDWNTVPSNKSSRFVQTKKPSGPPSGAELSSGPMLAPNRGSSWGAPGISGQLPPKTPSFVPPRMQNLQNQNQGGRFGVLSQEDRAPPSTPLREEIVQPIPQPLRPLGSRESSRPQTPTRDQPSKPEPIAVQPPPPPPPKDLAPVATGECVKNIFAEFMQTANWEDMIFYIRERFSGDKIVEFVDELSRQVCEMSKESHEKGAGAVIKGLIKRGLINKAQVIQVFTEGVMLELPDIEVDVPKVTSYMGVFLVELFLDEPDLSWLLPLGEVLEEDGSTVWTDLVTNTLNFLKLRLSEESVQVLYKKTQNRNRLPVQELTWVTGESVEALSKKMVMVLENEKDLAILSQSFKENSWDLREELTRMSLTDAICQISWKSGTGWDIPVLQQLLPQLNIVSPKMHPQLWGQAKDFITRNSIHKNAEEELWAEMYKLKLITKDSQQTPYC